MANGSWVRVDSNNSVRAELAMSVSLGSTSATVSWTLRLRKNASSGFVSDTGTWLVTSADMSNQSGSRSWSLNGSSSSVLFASGSFSVARNYSSRNVSMAGRINRNVVMDDDAFVVASVTIPRRTYSQPATPSSVSATRVSDSRIDLSWSVSSTTSAPVQSVEVLRRSNVTEQYTTIANLSGAQTSFSDRSAAANRRFIYAVRAKNSDSNSGFGYSPNIHTTPSTPSAPSVTKLSSGDIRISRPSTFPEIASEWEVWPAESGAPGTLLGTYPASQSTVLHASPDPAETHAYRVRARVSPPSLTSGFSPFSATVALQAAPLAPTELSPTVADASEELLLRWRHNPVDSAEQSQYQVRRRQAGFTTWTTSAETTSGSAVHALPGGTYLNGISIEWQVRTRGAHPNFSPWSQTAVTVLSARPVAGISAPGSLVTSARVTVQYTYHDPEASSMTQARITLWRDNTLLESRTTYSLGLGAVLLNTRVEDGASYTVQVEVRDGAGMWSAPVTQDFLVQYAPPPTPSVTADWEPDSGRVTLTVDAPPPDISKQTLSSIRVERAHGDGWVLIAAGIINGGSVVDTIPPTGMAVTYRAVAVSVIDSEAVSAPVSVETKTRWVYLNYGANFGSVVKVYGNLEASRSHQTGKSLVQYAGRRDPVERASIARAREYSLSAAMFSPSLVDPDPTSNWDDMVALEEAPGPVCVRDPEGVRMFVSVGGIEQSGHLKHLPRVSMNLTAVDYAEAQA